MTIQQKINQLVQEIEQEVIGLRREFHQHPELGMEEIETSKRVADFLHKQGIAVETGVAKTGVVGILKGGKPGPTLALRADMDALPVMEKTGLDFASKTPGKMHACGHDGHTAILLGTAKVLASLKEELPGTVKFIFQPAEEGPGGAVPMIEAGVLKNPDVDAIFGLHFWPDFAPGEIGLNYGPMMAAPDCFTLKIKGKGGHGSAPHETVDAITVAAQAITGLQHIASRQIKPTQPVVVTIGTIKGGYRYNVIADEVELSGTVRTLSPEVREEVPKRMKEIVGGITSAYGAEFELDYQKMYPPLINQKEMAQLVENVGRQVLGEENVKLIDAPVMGGEDFAYFLQEVPGTFFRLGCCSGPETSYPLHHSQFTIDEKALCSGVEVMANLVFQYPS